MKKMKLIITESQRNFLVRKVILNENIYGKKVIEQLSKKWNSQIDDKLENKLAIAGLWRDKFGDINKIGSVDELDNKFSEWYNGFINELLNTTDFVDNEEAAKIYLNGFVKNIKTLKDKAVKVSPKNLKKYVEGHNNWVDLEIKDVDIYNPKNEDILFENDEIVVLDTDTRDKCVIYGKGESWCITKTNSNYYTTYRIEDNASIYFVLQKNVKGDEHKLVIMAYKDDLYSIADQSNSPGIQRAGLKKDAIGWSEVEDQIPNLRGLKHLFKHIPMTTQEIEYQKLIDTFPTKLLNWVNTDNLSLQKILEKETELFNSKNYNIKITSGDLIRDISKHQKYDWIPYKHLKSLDEKTMNSLIETNYFTENSYSIGLEALKDAPQDPSNPFKSVGEPKILGLYNLPNLSRAQKNRIIQLKMKDDKLDFGDWINMDYETKMKNNFIKHHIRLDFPTKFLKYLEPEMIKPYIEINYFANHPANKYDYSNYYEFDNITDTQKQIILLQRMNGNILNDEDIEYILNSFPPSTFNVSTWDDFIIKQPLKYKYKNDNVSFFKGYLPHLDNNQKRNLLDKIISYHNLKDSNVRTNQNLKKFVLNQYTKLENISTEELKQLAKELIGDFSPSSFLRN